MKNPFLNDPRYRLELAFNSIPKNAKNVLDYGCGWGELIGVLSKQDFKVYGVEPDQDKVSFIEKKYPRVNFISEISDKYVKDNFFDVILLLEVLEHVPNEKKLLDELFRILRPDGTLILSVPHKGLTEIFDPGNLKFRSPFLHKLLYKYIFKQPKYEERYLQSKLVGDITRQSNMWHRHYGTQDINKLVNKRFGVERVYYYGLFFPIIAMLQQIIKWFFKKDLFFLKKLIMRDSRKNYGKLSYFILVKMIKNEKV